MKTYCMGILTLKKITIVLFSFTLFTTAAAQANENTLFSLQNLERERAALLVTLTSDKLSVDERYRKADSIIRRLADIERMVLRDDRLTGNNSVMVKKTFARYELSFLIHASTEAKKLPMDHWLTEFNFTTDSLLNTSVGSR